MPSAEVKERFAQDLGRWLTDGLVDQRTADTLHARYAAPSAGLAGMIRVVGMAGGAMAFFGLLGAIAAAANAPTFDIALLVAIGGGLLWLGIRLSRDPSGRYGMSARMMLALGGGALCGGAALTLAELKVSDVPFWLGVFALPPAFALAYLTRTATLLWLAVLGAFSWVGFCAGDALSDRAAIAGTSALAAGAIAVGAWHRLKLVRQTGRFHLVYEIAGLTFFCGASLAVYLDHWSHPRLWPLVFMAVALAQLGVGARLHAPLYTGFGAAVLTASFVVWFWAAWDERWSESPGLFLVLSGAVLFGGGLGFEVFARKRKTKPAEPAP